MKSFAWYKITHNSSDGSKYGWIIVRRNDQGSAVVIAAGYSSDSFRTAAESIISRAADPAAYYVINPDNGSRVYTLARVLYAIRHTCWRSMPRLFAAAA